MNTHGILVFARMNSARLPGKVLMDFGGMPMVLWIMRRAQLIGVPVSLACSSESSDDELAQCVSDAGFAIYRGELDDVLARAIAAANHFSWTHIARLCADRPFFDTNEMRTGLAIAADQPALDLTSNNLTGQAPAGLTTEIIRVGALEIAAASSLLTRHREHLTAFLYDHRAEFQTRSLPHAKLPVWLKTTQFAVDTLADYQHLSFIAQNCAPDVTIERAFQSQRQRFEHEANARA